MMSVVTCPNCGIGSLEPWVVVATGARLKVCDECSAAWPELVTPDVQTGVDVEVYLEREGLNPKVKQLDRLPGRD
jgi:hypothetical protein